ncbi:hypothetical protein DdX_12428 [Ditylenchus destructor]|uniref:Uncharacterized protein n=1 Tax=Ditylenchus destructor TaxID=166010 RepID=A0AAD4MVS6_9BILA|nr:hypothetical protein DdX_12428 [Ditylenchus destructor]
MAVREAPRMHANRFLANSKALPGIKRLSKTKKKRLFPPSSIFSFHQPYDQMTQSIENGIENSPALISNSKEPKYLIENATLLVPWRDFHAEVRGWMDTRNLVEKCCVLLDVENIELTDILNRMIGELNQKLFELGTVHNKSNKGPMKGPQITYEKIRKQIFNEIGHGGS